MRVTRTLLITTLVLGLVLTLAAQNPPAGGGAAGQRGGRGGGGAAAPPADARGGAPAANPQRGGGGNRGGGFQLMTMITTAWADGGMIPLRYTQAGGEISPSIQWQNVPGPVTQQDGTVISTKSFALVFHDADSLVNGTTDGLLHWLVWNIPGTATSLAPGIPDGFELTEPAALNGIRQMSVSGSRYRGPGAPAAGPIHHYIMELYALDTMLDIKVPVQGPQEANPSTQQIRTQIMQAMVGHIRGKASYVGLFHRPQ